MIMRSISHKQYAWSIAPGEGRGGDFVHIHDVGWDCTALEWMPIKCQEPRIADDVSMASSPKGNPSVLNRLILAHCKQLILCNWLLSLVSGSTAFPECSARPGTVCCGDPRMQCWCGRRTSLRIISGFACGKRETSTERTRMSTWLVELLSHISLGSDENQELKKTVQEIRLAVVNLHAGWHVVIVIVVSTVVFVGAFFLLYAFRLFDLARTGLRTLRSRRMSPTRTAWCSPTWDRHPRQKTSLCAR